MRLVLNVEALLMTPWTSYPFSMRSSARCYPSWPVMPVINAFLMAETGVSQGNRERTA